MSPSKVNVVIAITMSSVVGGCLSKGTGDAGGETHWMKRWLAGCVSSAECGAGMECIGHLCTVACERDSECTQTESASCEDLGGAKGCVLPERIGCAASGLVCDSRTEGWYCLAGVASGCSQPIAACDGTRWLDGTLDTCRDRVVTNTPADEGGPGPRATWQVTYGEAATPVDVLFVVDNSASMIGTQRSLSAAMGGFVRRLGASGRLDVRTAATTVDMQCDVNGTTVFSAKGVFNSRPAGAIPPPGQERIVAACAADDECPDAVCEATGECGTAATEWACRAASVSACSTNPNGTINTSCRRRCESDSDCMSHYGDNAVCQKPSANPSDWGCVLPLPSATCPSPSDAIVDASVDPDLTRCNVGVGSNQEKCLKFEQGLEASRAALDRSGPNAAQAEAFHRDGILVVVYVSDEEDCSTHGTIGEDDYETCGLLATTDQGGPLVPVREYIDFLEAQRRPGGVVVMAVTGQSMETDPTAISDDIAAYIASKSDSRTCYHQTSMCQTATRSADLGARYAAVAGGFGPDGAVDNICAVEDLADSLSRLEGKITANLQRACAPRAELTGLIVELAHLGVLVELSEGPGDAGYTVVEGAPECEHGTAIVPNIAIAPGDSVIFQLP